MRLSRNSTLSPSQTDRLLLNVLRLLSAAAGAVFILIVVFLMKEALPIFKKLSLLQFFTDPSWHPTEGRFNLVPMLAGSLLTTLGALILAVPFGILSAVFCQYYASQKIAGFYQTVLALLAGIPSVVYGLWGLVVLVPLIRQIHPPGTSLLAGILILGLMILPTIALTANSAFAHVPEDDLQNAAALGLSCWQTVRGVVLPAAQPALVTGIVLAIGRAIGETMAVLMVAGNVVQIPQSLFDPVRTLTANIALEMSYAMDEHRAALFMGGLILMGIIVFLMMLYGQMKASP